MRLIEPREPQPRAAEVFISGSVALFAYNRFTAYGSPP